MSDSSDGIERRRSLRLDMEKELVDMEWTDVNGQNRNKKIACLDFSRGGLKLDCDETLPLNTPVTVVFKSANARSQKLYGKVLRSIKKETGWFEVALILVKDD